MVHKKRKHPFYFAFLSWPFHLRHPRKFAHKEFSAAWMTPQSRSLLLLVYASELDTAPAVHVTSVCITCTLSSTRLRLTFQVDPLTASAESSSREAAAVLLGRPCDRQALASTSIGVLVWTSFAVLVPLAATPLSGPALNRKFDPVGIFLTSQSSGGLVAFVLLPLGRSPSGCRGRREPFWR